MDHTDVATIARVGDAWDRWYDAYGFSNGAMRLHHADGTHQNDRGGYLAAATIYEMITGSSTVGNSYSGAVNGSFAGDSIVSLLQQQATAVTDVDAVVNADFDDDLDVDGDDLLTWQRGIGLGSAQRPDGDANGDALVDAEDLAVWQQQFGAGGSSLTARVAAVPEPAAVAGVVIAALAATLSGRRRL